MTGHTPLLLRQARGAAPKPSECPYKRAMQFNKHGTAQARPELRLNMNLLIEFAQRRFRYMTGHTLLLHRLARGAAPKQRERPTKLSV